MKNLRAINFAKKIGTKIFLFQLFEIFTFFQENMSDAEFFRAFFFHFQMYFNFKRSNLIWLVFQLLVLVNFVYKLC